MPKEISRRWTERLGRPIFEGYGLTETSPFAAYNHDFHHRFGSVGTAVENFELRIVDEGDAEVPLGSLGETAVYKAPSRVDFVSELPKSATGKILKRVLWERV